jgi:hypothetical protein
VYALRCLPGRLSLPPQARSLERFTERRIMLVVRRSLAACTALFTAVAAGGVVLFGSATKDNILLNLTPEAVARLAPPAAAAALCFLIRLGYCACLMVSRGLCAHTTRLRRPR